MFSRAFKLTPGTRGLTWGLVSKMLNLQDFSDQDSKQGGPHLVIVGYPNTVLGPTSISY